MYIPRQSKLFLNRESHSTAWPSLRG